MYVYACVHDAYLVWHVMKIYSGEVWAMIGYHGPLWATFRHVIDFNINWANWRHVRNMEGQCIILAPACITSPLAEFKPPRPMLLIIVWKLLLYKCIIIVISIIVINTMFSSVHSDWCPFRLVGQFDVRPGLWIVYREH